MRDEDKDVAAALPKAPPPSPARRTAAIEDAMRRFDGGEATLPAGRQRPEPRRASWWAALRRPQVAGLVSIALIAVVATPIAWETIDRQSVPNMRESGSEIARVAQPARPVAPVETTMVRPGAPPREPPADRMAEAPFAQAAQPNACAGTDCAPAGPRQEIVLPAPTPAPIVAAPPAISDNARNIVVTGANIRGAAPTGTNVIGTGREEIQATGQTSSDQLLAQLPQAHGFNALPQVLVDGHRTSGVAQKPNSYSPPHAKAAPPPPRPSSPAAAPAGNAAPAETMRQAERADAEESTKDVVVTGTQIRGRRASDPSRARGDWNACTVNDPGQSLSRCKAMVNPGAAGTTGRAAARLADGLSRAWQGDFDEAIAAFDQAIALSPRLAFAYLNRGLARQHQGDLDRAIADFNLAVRYAPDAARGYYNRSIALRQRGDARRADADTERAAELDPGYEALAK